MSISELFIRRPVMTTLVMLAIVLFGAMAFRTLPVSDLPSVDFPTLSVSASLPGASPATMASSVATPLERQFSAIAGVDSMTSVSTLGSSQISLQFDLTRNIDGAAVDVVTAINAATPLLPPGMPSPPSFRKSNPADSPILLDHTPQNPRRHQNRRRLRDAHSLVELAEPDSGRSFVGHDTLALTRHAC